MSKHPKNHITEKAADFIDSITWEVSWNWDNYLIQPFRTFKQGILNLWTWKGIIFRDRWYDHSYFHIILKKKLQLMEKGWDGAHYVGSEKTQEQITELIEILSKIEQHEDYEISHHSDAEISRLYEEFGEKLFKRRDHVKYGETPDKNTIYKGTLMETLWD